MRYADPELRERLAAEFVLGTMPTRARRRFERLMMDEPDFGRLVAHWGTRFAPLDEATPPQAPPARVWREIERRIGFANGYEPRIFPAWLAFWRGLAVAASGALAAMIVYLVIAPPPPAPVVVAVLTDKAGDPAWIALGQPGRGEVRVSPVRPLIQDGEHSFELWGIAAGGAPRPLGLLAPHPDRPLVLGSAELPPVGGVLAVSLESAKRFAERIADRSGAVPGKAPGGAVTKKI